MWEKGCWMLDLGYWFKTQKEPARSASSNQHLTSNIQNESQSMRILFAALSCGLALGQTMTIEEYEPKSTLVVPQHPVTRAKYPFIDVHNHQSRCLKPECVDKLVSDMDALNLRVMVDLSGGSVAQRKHTEDAQQGPRKSRPRGVAHSQLLHTAA